MILHTLFLRSELKLPIFEELELLLLFDWEVRTPHPMGARFFFVGKRKGHPPSK